MLKTVATAPFQLVRSGASLVAGAAQDGVNSPRSDAGGGVADQWCGRTRVAGAVLCWQLSHRDVQPATVSCCFEVSSAGEQMRGMCRIDFLIQQAEAAQAEEGAGGAAEGDAGQGTQVSASAGATA